MTYATLALQGFGTALNVFGALQSGGSAVENLRNKTEAEARISEARADADSFNAKVSRQMADSEEQQAAGTAADYRRINRAKLASRKAVPTGLALEGSPLLVNREIFEEIEFGADRISYGGRLNASRLRQRADTLDVSSANNRITAGFTRAAGAAGVNNLERATAMRAAAYGISGAADIGKTLSTKGYSSPWENAKTSKATQWEDEDNYFLWNGKDKGYW